MIIIYKNLLLGLLSGLAGALNAVPGLGQLITMILDILLALLQAISNLTGINVGKSTQHISISNMLNLTFIVYRSKSHIKYPSPRTGS